MKKTKNHDAKYMLLKKTGLLYKRDVLTRPVTMFIISAIATVCDGITVFISLDPLLGGAWYFNLLLTLVSAFILDLGPCYFGYGIEQIKHSPNRFDRVLNKTILTIAVCSWFLVMFALCAIRYSEVDFILESLIESTLSANEYATDSFTPQVTNALKFSIITFMNFLNIATSAFVLLASHVAFTSKEERDKQKAATFSYYIENFKAELESERKQLEDVIDDDTTNTYEEKRANNAIEVAEKQAQIKKQEAVEELEKFHSDGDVTEKITSLYRK